MSTDDHTPAQLNDTPNVVQDENISMGDHDHDQPSEVATMPVVSANPPNGVPPRLEVHVVDDEVTTNHVNTSPSVQPTPQTVPLDDITEPELGDKEAETIVGGEPDGQKEEIEGHGDSGDSDGADDGDDDETGEEDRGERGEEEEEDEEDDEDEDEPALKYERFGGAFQDLLKKDSASVLAVSNKFLVMGDVIT
jgi:hypothetical protein